MRFIWNIRTTYDALSFYRSQNGLCRSKFFVLDQKFIYILCQSQVFCARQKDDLHSVKLVFVSAQKFLKRHKLNAVNFLGWLKTFGPAQNILQPVKGQGITVLSKLVQDPMKTHRNRNATWELIWIHCTLKITLNALSIFDKKLHARYVVFLPIII